MSDTATTDKTRQQYSTISPLPATAPLFSLLPRTRQNIVDLLRTAPSPHSFEERVRRLHLSAALESKICENHDTRRPAVYLTEHEEKELATEVLLRRHSFTRSVFSNSLFRQAALTIIQNIYLFQQRRIFFGTPRLGTSGEREEALHLFSSSPETTSIPLAKTFQHLIVARVWDRIVAQADNDIINTAPFHHLHEIVEQLNTLRNIYIIFSRGLVWKLTRNIPGVYQQSITPDDALQIGHFGVARAAYRYHPSIGQRFSTYAAYWVKKEIQRQSLDGRLIRISAHLVEQAAKAVKSGDTAQQKKVAEEILRKTARILTHESHLSTEGVQHNTVEKNVEANETARALERAMAVLSPKCRDVIERRFGLGPHKGNPQSIIAISKMRGVSRSSVYQLEQSALAAMRRHLRRRRV